jgi:hypothetical protein
VVSTFLFDELIFFHRWVQSLSALWFKAYSGTKNRFKFPKVALSRLKPGNCT